jgi:predicted MFS family arabinose efflux permease
MDTKLSQYLTVTGCYWAFTLTDGALRMLVVLYFHQLGYGALEIASLFILYEFFGMITNLFGGWLAAHKGLNLTLKLGLIIQIIALLMLLLPPSLLTIAYVMLVQALSGIAKDLSKMSAKSSIKTLIPEDAQSKLYHWIAILTGSKNALKGVGYFLGAALLGLIGFQGAVISLAIMLCLALISSVYLLEDDLGNQPFKAKFKTLFSKSTEINRLSAARLFLFGARDIWFVVALPVYLQTQLAWSHIEVGTLLAVWIIIYGFMQTLSPKITKAISNRAPNGYSTFLWALPLIIITALLAFFESTIGLSSETLVITLLIFGAFFAINSSIHSYLIIAYAKVEGVSLDVGFYYMANAAGRLIGTLLSGFLYQYYSLEVCLIASALFIAIAAGISFFLPKHH